MTPDLYRNVRFSGCPISGQAVAVLITVAVLASFEGAAQAQSGRSPSTLPAAATQPADERQSLQARVLKVEGNVSYALVDAGGVQGDWRPARADDLLPAGTRIRTRTRSQLLLKLGDDTVVLIERATLASIDQFHRMGDTKVIRLGLGHGAVRGGVAETELRSDLTIDTPTATLSKRGTIGFRIEYEPSLGQFRISLDSEGLVEALNKLTNENRAIKPGQYVTQLMVAWIVSASFDRWVPMVDIFGQTDLEKWFNMLQQSGIAVTDPGSGAGAWSSPSRQGGEQAGYRSALMNQFTNGRVNIPPTSAVTPVLNRPEGNFGTGGAPLPEFSRQRR